MRRWAIGSALGVTLTMGAAQAETPQHLTARALGLDAAACATSFMVRLKSARDAFVARDTYAREYDRVMPWYGEHCRQLTALEIAVRHIDDPNTFVCDTQKGRPSGLTPKFVVTHGVAPGDISAFDEHANESFACAALGDPVSLDLHGLPAEASASKVVKLTALVRQLEVMCYDDARPKCTKPLADARALLSAANQPQ